VPAAAVIPAPIAYIKVVAVKKLVVGFRDRLFLFLFFFFLRKKRKRKKKDLVWVFFSIY